MKSGVYVPGVWQGAGKPLRSRAFRAEIVDPGGGFVRQLRVTDGVVDESDLFNPTSGAGNLAASPHIVKVTQLDDNNPSPSSYWYHDTHDWQGPFSDIPNIEHAPPEQQYPELSL